MNFCLSPFPKNNFILLNYLILFIQLFNYNKASDVFTAMVDIENLLLSEVSGTSQVIEQYIKSEQERLNKLRELGNLNFLFRRPRFCVHKGLNGLF